MYILISLIGGLGLFLYGMNIMGEGLQKSTGPKLEKAIELLTSNVVMGVLVGAVVTGIIQSSGATTVMVVGFVNAGIMTLYQAIGIIMGANIGTTVTAQLVSFDVSILSSIALGIGIVLYMIGLKSKPTLKNISEILIGFAILFIGMRFMKDAVAPLSEYPFVRSILASIANQPILALIAGFLMTTCLQSSSASMGILIALASQGLMPLHGALPILYGDNIGSCTTSLLSSIGTNKNAKRAALMHLCFNVIGTLLFMFILNKPITMIVTRLDPTDISRQIANSHTLFNLINVVLLLPFSNCKLSIADQIEVYQIHLLFSWSTQLTHFLALGIHVWPNAQVSSVGYQCSGNGNAMCTREYDFFHASHLPSAQQPVPGKPKLSHLLTIKGTSFPK